jgi:hypothetical protein
MASEYVILEGDTMIFVIKLIKCIQKLPDWFANWIGMKWGFWFSFWGLIVADIILTSIMMLTGPQTKPSNPNIFWFSFWGDSLLKLLSQQVIQLLALFSLQMVQKRNNDLAEDRYQAQEIRAKEDHRAIMDLVCFLHDKNENKLNEIKEKQNIHAEKVDIIHNILEVKL